jgi:glycosyltransferase involved in cell wall biosynthesis
MLAHRGPRGRTDSLTSLIFPVYNPGRQAEKTWDEVRRFLAEAPGAWEVLFVCDGCTDGTTDRLAWLARRHTDRVRVLGHAPNHGKGYAVRQGLRAARGAWRIFTDIDLAYGFEDVLRLARALWDGAEVAVASRSHRDSRVVLRPWLQGYAFRRHVQSVAFSLLARLLLPIRQADTQAGLKGMSARVAELVLPHLRCDGFSFDCEFLTACARYGIPVKEVPVCVRVEDRASTTGLCCVGRMIGDLWSIRRAWRTPPRPVAIPVRPVERRQAA